MASGYAVFEDLSSAQAWIDLVSDELGYPNSTTETYSMAVRHQTDARYSVVVDDASTSRQSGLTILTKAQARTQGFLPEFVNL